MPENKLKVTWKEGEGYRCGVWDKNGQATEVTNIFEGIRGSSGLAPNDTTRLSLRKGDVRVVIDVVCSEKDLDFQVTEQIINQILALHQDD